MEAYLFEIRLSTTLANLERATNKLSLCTTFGYSVLKNRRVVFMNLLRFRCFSRIKLLQLGLPNDGEGNLKGSALFIAPVFNGWDRCMSGYP
jgi:hypothetical protein